MKLFVFNILCCIFLLSCSGTYDRTNTSLPDSLQKTFNEVSYFIAYQYMISDTNSLLYRQTEIPDTLRNDIYNCLISIYSNPFYSSVDSLYKIHQLYGFYTEHVKEIILSLDTNHQWVKNLLAKKETGNIFVDSIIKKYSITLRKDTIAGFGAFENYGNQYTFIDSLNKVYRYVNRMPLYFTLDRAVNVDEFSKRFRNIEGVEWSDKIQLVGGSSKQIIYKQLKKGHKKLSYILAWGDCPSGCINMHQWDIVLDEDYDIVSVKSFGDAIPEDWEMY